VLIRESLSSPHRGRTPNGCGVNDPKRRTPAAVDRLGLKGALSSQRANGLSAMVERIRQEAQAAVAA
jgi:sulfur transfer protein SufE